jgi:hypothetical protein
VADSKQTSQFTSESNQRKGMKRWSYRPDDDDDDDDDDEAAEAAVAAVTGFRLAGSQ